jgi:hypothetical protein
MSRSIVGLLSASLAWSGAISADSLAAEPAANQWSRTSAAMPALRPGAALVTLGEAGRLLAVGGSCDTTEDKAAPGAQTLDPATGKWTPLAAPKPPLLPIYRAACDPAGKRVYCLSQTMNATGNACLPQGQLDVLDLASNAWTRHAPDPALADLDWLVCAIDPEQHKLVIVGADKRAGMNGWSRTVIYDIASGKYSQLPPPDDKVVQSHKALLSARDQLAGLIGQLRLAWFGDPKGVGTEAELKQLRAACEELAKVAAMSPYRGELADCGSLLSSRKTLDSLKAAQALLRKIELDAEAEYPAPPSRQNSPLVYDARNKVFVLFGGDHQDYLTNDTWVLDLAKGWRRAKPQAAPAPRGPGTH